MEILIETLKRESGLYYVWITPLTETDVLICFRGFSYDFEGREVEIKRYEILGETQKKVCYGRINTMRKRGLPLIRKNTFSNIIALSSEYKDRMVRWVLEAEK
jgi:hypothetical protein